MSQSISPGHSLYHGSLVKCGKKKKLARKSDPGGPMMLLSGWKLVRHIFSERFMLRLGSPTHLSPEIHHFCSGSQSKPLLTPARSGSEHVCQLLKIIIFFKIHYLIFQGHKLSSKHKFMLVSSSCPKGSS